MIYSLGLLVTVGDCDALLTQVALQKKDIEFKKYQLDKKHQSITTNTLNIETERPSLVAEISAYQGVIANLPDGDAKTAMQSKLTKTEHKLFLLNEKAASYGAVSLNTLEFQLNCVENDIVAVDDFTAQIEARKAAL
jgi:hypothetical protein